MGGGYQCNGEVRPFGFIISLSRCSGKTTNPLGSDPTVAFRQATEVIAPYVIEYGFEKDKVNIL
jgi:hypothetical protein